MRRLAALQVLCIGLALSACGPPEGAKPVGETDPERAAVAFFNGHVFDEPVELQRWFADTVNPADLPLRLILSGPEAYAFEDLWRLRMVDGRAVVSALLKLNGEPHSYDVWLEQREGVWRISGWADYPVPVDANKAAPPAGARIPAPLAKSTFRDIHEVPVLPLRKRAAVVEQADPEVTARFKPPTVEGPCNADRVHKALKQLQKPMAQCYAAAVDPAQRRAGRLTVQFTVPQAAPVASVEVLETTLLALGLNDCAEEAVKRDMPLLKRQKGACTVTARVVFTPQ